MPTRREVLKLLGGAGAAAGAFAVANTIAKPVEAASNILHSIEAMAGVDVVDLEIGCIKQQYKLSCESAAAGQVLSKLTGAGIGDWEDTIILNLTQTSSPSTGFWGEINGKYGIYGIPEGDNLPITPPIASHTGMGYGVHWGPMADAMNRMGEQHQTAKAEFLNYESLAQNLRDGKPVLLWVINSNYRYSRVLDDGTKVWFCEHCVAATGVRPAGNGTYEFLINDPYNGFKIWNNQSSGYMRSWADNFGGASVVVEPKKPLLPKTYLPAVNEVVTGNNQTSMIRNRSRVL